MADIINSDVSQATGGVIRNLLDADALRNIQMVLVNAVYIKGFWDNKFDVDQTVPVVSLKNDEKIIRMKKM